MHGLSCNHSHCRRLEVVVPLRLGAWAASRDDQPPTTASLLALLPGLLPGLLLLHPRTHAW